MSGSEVHNKEISGLSADQLPDLQRVFGKNIFIRGKQWSLAKLLNGMFREPMFVLLIFACVIYFILGESKEGWMMLTAMLFVAAISIYQDIRSTKALDALKELTQPQVVVVRDNKEKMIESAELLPGDVILLEEGNKIPADATVTRQNDLSINESVITGESLPITKNEVTGHNILYQGTTIHSGKCYAVVTATGNQTQLSKIGKFITNNTVPKTLLQQQMNKFTRQLALFGLVGFGTIWVVNYVKTGDIISSLLLGLTLAMASIPEEVPVAFSSFMALGAFHMSKYGIISKHPQTIENLGAVSVICLDKTGTITENKMRLQSLYDNNSYQLIELVEDTVVPYCEVLKYGAWASEVSPFDPMEKAICESWAKVTGTSIKKRFPMLWEYPLGGKPPMMTHVYAQGNEKIAAGKGSPERIFRICSLDETTIRRMNGYIDEMTSKGYRVIGVASAIHNGDTMPVLQDDFKWRFEGLLALYDPPKRNIREIFRTFYTARINIKILTGDFHGTAINIARQVGLQNAGNFLTGDDVMEMSEVNLRKAIQNTNVFARMFPDAKLKVIEALKANGEIVAMTGDGVNDASALHSSHIGIAMGGKGTEIARQASDLILSDDNLEHIAQAILQGRKIFSNLKKAVRYIISIHIPIILTAALPVLFGWKYANLFTPVHIIFLELIMGPTCSIFFEREPVEKDIMQQRPRARSRGLFTNTEILISITQGLTIATGLLVLYRGYMQLHSLEETRTIVFTTLLLSNIFLTFTNRSFSENIIRTIRYRNSLALPVLLTSILFLCIIHLIVPVRNLFGMVAIHPEDFMLCALVAFTCVGWFEAYKMVDKNHSKY